MARKSKRLAVKEIKPSEIKEKYSVAVYLRLSVAEKRDKEDNESLTNQKDIILDFIKDKPDMKIYDVYVDDGESGTNFMRDEFKRMMYDIYSNRVNCIIVKDLSRFGREYIEAGDYLDKIFPLLGVRFIAINDNVDNHIAPFDVSVPIKNIVNSMYARDISKKSSAALKIKQINGDFIGGQAPYGYLINPEDNHKLIVNPETAPTVKQIFEWKAEGRSYQAISRELYVLNIMPPARYKYDRGIIKDKRFADIMLWNTAMIKSILTSETYIGNMTQGKTKSYFLDGAARKKTAESDWIIVKGTHEPIVSEELFYKVREKIDKIRECYYENAGKHKQFKNSNYFFKGKLVCGECGSKIKRTATFDARLKKTFYTYNCRKRIEFPDLCDLTPISEQALNNIVIAAVRAQIIQLCDLKKALEKALRKDNVRAKYMEFSKKTNDIISEIAFLKSDRLSLTKKFAGGELNAEKYEKEKSDIDNRLAAAKNSLESAEKSRESSDKILSAEKWIDELKKHKKEKYLTCGIAEAFIKQITLYKDKRIEIEWTYQDRRNEILSQIKEGC